MGGIVNTRKEGAALPMVDDRCTSVRLHIGVNDLKLSSGDAYERLDFSRAGSHVRQRLVLIRGSFDDVDGFVDIGDPSHSSSLITRYSRKLGAFCGRVEIGDQDPDGGGRSVSYDNGVLGDLVRHGKCRAE